MLPMSIDDSPLRDRVIFVEGAPRSGTTFLTAMLSGHDEIAGITGEPRLFEQGVGALFDNHEAGGNLDKFVTREELTELVRGFVDGVLVRLREATRPSAKLVVEKTPVPRRDPSLVLRRKLECYPDAWYLHIIREGDAVTRSLSRAPWGRVMSEAERRAWWKGSVDAVRDVLGGQRRYREIHYENLANDPLATMEEVFGWLQLDFDDETRARLRLLSKERYADLGPIGLEPGGRVELEPRPKQTRSTRRAGAAASSMLGRAARRGRRRARDRRPSSIADSFAEAFRERDADALERLLHPEVELSAHSGEGDLHVRGAGARDSLLEISRRVFAGTFLSESWTLLESDTPSILFSGTRHDGTRSDAWWVLALRGGRVERVGLMVPGAVGGGPMMDWRVSEGASP